VDFTERFFKPRSYYWQAIALTATDETIPTERDSEQDLFNLD